MLYVYFLTDGIKGYDFIYGDKEEFDILSSHRLEVVYNGEDTQRYECRCNKISVYYLKEEIKTIMYVTLSKNELPPEGLMCLYSESDHTICDIIC